MKKVLFFLTVILLFTSTVYAKNEIYSIDMEIYLDQSGNATFTEYWNVKAEDGSEWYRQYTDLGNSEVTNFKVLMDEVLLTKKEWNTEESLEQKNGYYGVNKTSNGIELCFGKGDYQEHKFTLSYNVSNIIFNTDDSQILYWRLIEQLNDIDIQKFSATIKGFYSFPNDLDVWSTGYEGLNYLDDGVIKLTNIEKADLEDKDYIVVLVKFPLNTFSTNNSYSMYQSFEQVKSAYDEGKYSYHESSIWAKIIPVALFGAIVGGIIYASRKNGYGYKNNKKIKEKETPAFRDIPCKKDLFYANVLMKLNKFGYDETNIIGSLILKWVKEKKIEFIKTTEVKTFKNKETYYLDLTKKATFDNEYEQKIYDIMVESSKDGKLESYEFRNWALSNAKRFQELFKKITDECEEQLKKDGHIYKRKTKDECSCVNVMDDKIYDDSKQLLGLKIFLKEFSEIDKKETIEVHLWQEYLMFAYLFGIADKVLSQLKKLYPEIIQQEANKYQAVSMASSLISEVLSAANAYSGGDGKYSTGGGGGGSFGGGGVGSR